MSDALRHRAKLVAWLVVWALLLLAPLQLSQFWEQTGLFAMSAAIGAIGLTLLVGVTGQLSLATAFFVAIGAYGYSYLGGESGGVGGALTAPQGLGWPPWLLMSAAPIELGGMPGLSGW